MMATYKYIHSNVQPVTAKLTRKLLMNIIWVFEQSNNLVSLMCVIYCFLHLQAVLLCRLLSQLVCFSSIHLSVQKPHLTHLYKTYKSVILNIYMYIFLSLHTHITLSFSHTYTEYKQSLY